MTPPDFRDALRSNPPETPPDPESRRRVRARLEVQIQRDLAASESRKWKLAIGGAFAVAAVALVVLVSVLTPQQQVQGLAVLTLEAGARASEVNGVVEVSGGRVRLADAAGATFTVDPGSTLARDGDAYRVVSGRAEVVVRKRTASEAPYRVAVSHATITVLGTRFAIVQDAAGGTVSLLEGHIRLDHQNGTVEDLLAGQSARWPVRVPDPMPSLVPPVVPEPAPIVEPPPVIAPPPPAPKPPPVPVVAPSTPAPAPAPVEIPAPVKEAEIRRSGELLRKIEVLRSREKYDEAARTLAAELDTGYGPETRERLSLELVSILTYQIGDAARACAIIGTHLTTYGTTRYGPELARARQHARCPEGP